MSDKNVVFKASELDGSTFIAVNFHRFGNRAKIKDKAAHMEYQRLLHLPEGEDESANATVANYRPATVDKTTSSKELMQSEALDAINEALDDLKDKLIGKNRGIAQPSYVFKGFYTIKKSFVPRAEAMAAEVQAKLEKELRPAFRSDYDAAKERARTLPVRKGGLGPIFDPTDYPPAETAAARFWFEVNYLNLRVEDDIPEEVKAAKQAEWIAKREAGFSKMMEALRLSFAALIDHAVEKLTVLPGEKPKVFRDTTIENIKDFISSFSAKNFGDSALEDLVNRAQEIVSMGDSDPERLRKSLSARDNIANQFQKVQAALDTMITDRKSRKFDFSEDDSQG